MAQRSANNNDRYRIDIYGRPLTFTFNDTQQVSGITINFSNGTQQVTRRSEAVEHERWVTQVSMQPQQARQTTVDQDHVRLTLSMQPTDLVILVPDSQQPDHTIATANSVINISESLPVLGPAESQAAEPEAAESQAAEPEAVEPEPDLAQLDTHGAASPDYAGAATMNYQVSSRPSDTSE